MDQTLKCDHSLESCSAVLYCAAMSLVFNFNQFVILEKLSVMDSVLSGVKWLNGTVETSLYPTIAKYHDRWFYAQISVFNGLWYCDQ